MSSKRKKTTLEQAAAASGDRNIYEAKIAAALARSAPSNEDRGDDD